MPTWLIVILIVLALGGAMGLGMELGGEDWLRFLQ